MRGPILGNGFFAQVEDIALVRFQHDVFVAEVIELHRIEVVAATIDRYVRAPIIRHALIHQRTPEIDVAQPIRAAAKGRFDGGLGDISLRPVVFCVNRHAAVGKRQDGVRLRTLARDEAKLALGDDVDALQIRQRGFQRYGPMFLERIEGELHILCGDRFAIVPAGVRTQLEYHPSVVLVHVDAFGKAPIGTGRLVGGRFEQPLEIDVPRAAEVHAGGDTAFL